jgi:hypothetical protein
LAPFGIRNHAEVVLKMIAITNRNIAEAAALLIANI